MEILNQARGYSYLLGVLKTQQADPYCRSCNAFNKTLLAVKENLEKFETEHHAEIQNLSAEFSALFAEAKRGIAAMQQPENPDEPEESGKLQASGGRLFHKIVARHFSKSLTCLIYNIWQLEAPAGKPPAGVFC